MALLGRNGAGKSTTLKSIVGPLRPRPGGGRLQGGGGRGKEVLQDGGGGNGVVPGGMAGFFGIERGRGIGTGAEKGGRAGQTPGLGEGLGAVPKPQTKGERFGGAAGGGGPAEADGGRTA